MSAIVLVDGKNAIFRNQHTHNYFSREDGFPTGAIHGCLTSMLSIHRRLPEAAVVWCWDGVGETWRHKYMMDMPQIDAKAFDPVSDENDFSPEALARASLEFLGITDIKGPKRERKPGYKGNRNYKESKEKSYPTDPRGRGILQIPYLKLMLQGMGIRNYEIPCLECDDLIGMLTKKIIELDKHSRVYIQSGDRDFYQLLTYDQVSIVKGLKGDRLDLFLPADVVADFGVKPKHWTKYRALVGDSGDNIPHLFNIGPVRAKSMLKAGIDPSQETLSAIPKEAVEEYGKYFPHGIERMWPALYGNYNLCKIVCDYDSNLLSEEVKAKLKPMFEHFDSTKCFFRSKEGKTPESVRKVGFMFAQYELQSILSRRSELWSIP